MAKFILNIPDDLHDKLRHAKIDTGIDINEIIIQSVIKCQKEWTKK